MPVDDIEGREGINSNGLASIQQAYKNYTLDIFDVNKIDSSVVGQFEIK